MSEPSTAERRQLRLVFTAFGRVWVLPSIETLGMDHACNTRGMEFPEDGDVWKMAPSLRPCWRSSGLSLWARSFDPSLLQGPLPLSLHQILHAGGPHTKDQALGSLAEDILDAQFNKMVISLPANKTLLR
jgi:hypothetical protein